MCILFTGLGLLTAVIVFQMYRFSMSGFTDAKKDGTTPPAPTPATPSVPIAAWVHYAFFAAAIAFVLIVIGTGLAVYFKAI